MPGKTTNARVSEIRKWHVQDNGWRDVGYHFLIDRDGTIAHGRPVSNVGAFEKRVNANAIGICLLGGHGSQQNDAFEDHYTEAQDSSLRELIEQLQAQYPIRKVTGHNDYSGKACPGFRVKNWFERSRPRAFVASGTALGGAAAGTGGLGLAGVQALTEVQSQVEQVQIARDEAMQSVDPLRWVLLALVVCGAAYAIWRRWDDWRNGRQ